MRNPLEGKRSLGDARSRGAWAGTAAHWPRSLTLTALLIVGQVALAMLPGVSAAQSRSDIAWVEQAADGSARVQLYFFWSKRCPHCLSALPFVSDLDQQPWIDVHSHELTSSRDNVALYIAMAEALGEQAQSVPAFLVCGRMLTGFDGAEGMGQQILALIESCRAEALGDGGQNYNPLTTSTPGAAENAVQVPMLGELIPQNLSLPVFTLLLAGLDAFNPCAFFVLLFLLSLMAHARSRGRMLLIGGIFVLVSGLVYFLFMAAWLNLFLVLGAAPVVTLVAGLLAVLIGVLNTRDYFAIERGSTLAIPEGAKPGLFRRMRGLLSADSMTAMLMGTVALALALAANTYELLCTAGFPMVYTRVLTLNDLEPFHYYGYLAFYNVVYVLPLLAIVGLFTATLGRRKLSERHARLLKLLSGLMMLSLGLLMLTAPEALSRLWVGAALLGGALLVTAMVILVERRRRQVSLVTGARSR